MFESHSSLIPLKQTSRNNSRVAYRMIIFPSFMSLLSNIYLYFYYCNCYFLLIIFVVNNICIFLLYCAVIISFFIVLLLFMFVLQIFVYIIMPNIILFFLSFSWYPTLFPQKNISFYSYIYFNYIISVLKLDSNKK